MQLATSIEKLCALGGNVVISADGYLPSNLEKFAALSHKNGGTLTIKNCDKLFQGNLEKIVCIGKNNVTLDFTK